MGGKTEEFDAEITEQIPGARIAWTTTDGPKHGDVVDFHRLDDHRTQLMVVMDSQDDGVLERAADALGLVRRRGPATSSASRKVRGNMRQRFLGWLGVWLLPLLWRVARRRLRRRLRHPLRR